MFAASFTQIQSILLSNGLTVWLDTHPRATSLSIHGLVKAGSYHEQASQTGIAHFLEHMLFTESRNKDRFALNRMIPETGGDANAYTTYDHTAYECVVPASFSRHAKSWFDHVVLDASFSDAQVAIEKQIILQEAMQAKDQMDVVFEEALYEQMYPDHALGRPLVGNPQDIEKIQKQDLQSFYDQYYQPSNMLVIISATSAFDGWIEIWEGLAKGTPTEGSPAYRAMKPTQYEYEHKRAQPKIMWVFDLGDVSRATLLSWEVLALVLSDASFGSLYQHVREDHHWASHVHASVMQTTCSHQFVLEVHPMPGFEERLIQEISTLIEQGFRSILSKDALRFAVQDIQKSHHMSMQTTWHRVRWFASMWLHMHATDTLEKLDDVLQTSVQTNEMMTRAQSLCEKPTSIGISRRKMS